MSPTAGELEARLDRTDLVTEQKLSDHWAALDALKEKLDQVKERLERLPAWGVALFGLLTFLLGSSLTMVGVLGRMVTT